MPQHRRFRIPDPRRRHAGAPATPNEDRSGGFDQGRLAAASRTSTRRSATTSWAGWHEAGAFLLGRPNVRERSPRSGPISPPTTRSRRHDERRRPSTSSRRRLTGAAALAELDAHPRRRPRRRSAALREEHWQEHLLVIGSGELVQTLIRHGLVDEYRLMVHPIVLGKGKRLFRDLNAASRLRLVASKPTSTGVLLLTFVPAETR